MGRSYVPIDVFEIKNFIKEGRNLERSYFKLDSIQEGYFIPGPKKETLVYFDFMFEFERDPYFDEYKNEWEKELYFYIPIKFVISMDKSKTISDEEIKKCATKKMFEIKKNFDYCLMSRQERLIIQDRIVRIEI